MDFKQNDSQEILDIKKASSCPLDAENVKSGQCYHLYDVMGAKFKEFDGQNGVQFSCYAPNAVSVSLVGDLPKEYPMKQEDGIWHLFVPEVDEGIKYQFKIFDAEGDFQLKSDPFGHYFEYRPNISSIVYDIDRYEFRDQEWMQERKKSSLNRPVNIYEVHLGSWNKKFSSYRQLAHELASYCIDMGYTHIEILPITEHPLDESWGYQATGYFAPSSRYGQPYDFQYFVDYMHLQKIGVILDWVPGHFPLDQFGLSKFDGSFLYEYEDPKKGFHPKWNTAIFDYSKPYVCNFLISSALFWIEKMHIDAIRVDAVSSLIYLDFAREPGHWDPNIEGTHHNLEAIAFLKRLNSAIKDKHPDVWMIAEEASDFPKVTEFVENGGLGFDLKWNIGWVTDTLNYFSTPYAYRSKEHELLTFGLMYIFDEKFILPFSHDEVATGLKSLFAKMPGNEFSNLKVLYGYVMTHPGKKLLFMGSEFGQRMEWNCLESLSWELLEQKDHYLLQQYVKDLNHLYLGTEAFWEDDFSCNGFKWITCDDDQSSVIAYYRIAKRQIYFCVHNFSEKFYPQYEFALSCVKKITLMFNSDDYGEKKNTINFSNQSVDLPPLSTLIFKVDVDGQTDKK